MHAELRAARPAQEGPDKGRGVVWKRRCCTICCITDDAVQGPRRSVLIGDATVRDIPLPFRDDFCDLRDPDGYAQLVQRLYGRARAVKPAVGEVAPVPAGASAGAGANPAELDAIAKVLAPYRPIARVVRDAIRIAGGVARRLIEALAAESIPRPTARRSGWRLGGSRSSPREPLREVQPGPGGGVRAGHRDSGTLMYGYLQRSARAQVMQAGRTSCSKPRLATRAYTQQQITTASARRGAAAPFTRNGFRAMRRRSVCLRPRAVSGLRLSRADA